MPVPNLSDVNNSIGFLHDVVNEMRKEMEEMRRENAELKNTVVDVMNEMRNMIAMNSTSLYMASQPGGIYLRVEHTFVRLINKHIIFFPDISMASAHSFSVPSPSINFPVNADPLQSVSNRDIAEPTQLKKHSDRVLHYLEEVVRPDLKHQSGDTFEVKTQKKDKLVAIFSLLKNYGTAVINQLKVEIAGDSVLRNLTWGRFPEETRTGCMITLEETAKRGKVSIDRAINRWVAMRILALVTHNVLGDQEVFLLFICIGFCQLTKK